MSKAVRIVQNYLILALPLVIICMVWSSMREGSAAGMTSFLWETLSWNLMLWFATLFLFLLALIAFPIVRETTLTRLARVRERDEREQQITGRAARAAFLSTLSLLILMLFLSIFSVDLTRVPPDQAPAGKDRTLSIGAGFGFLDKPSSQSTENGETLFAYKTLPLSKPAVILIAIVWLLATFQLVAARESRA